MKINLISILELCLAAFVCIACSGVNNQTTRKENESIQDTLAVENQQLETTSTENIPNEDIEGFPDGSQMKTKVLRTGNFHSDEVWEEAAKEKWMGVFMNKDGFYLKETAVKLRRVHDAIVDNSEEQKTGWEVTTSVKDSNIILIEKLPYLAERKIKTVALSKNYIYPSESLSFSYLGHQYKIFATGIKRREHGSEVYEVRNYKLYLTANINGKETTQLLVEWHNLDDKMIELIFAGDIDGDGIIDLIIDTSRHYNVSSPTLYLSKPAGNGQIVKPVGYHDSVGC